MPTVRKFIEVQKKNDELLNRFFQMETEAGLFDLEKGNDLPVWDILRLHIYFKYYYPPEELDKLFQLPKRTKWDYIHLVLDLVHMPFYFLSRKGKNIFLTTSRGLNSENKYFDKSAYPLIKELGCDCFIIETNIKERTQYRTFNAFISLFKRFFNLGNLSPNTYAKVSESLTNAFGENKTTFDELNIIYRSVRGDFLYYRWLFGIKKTEKLFLSRGNEKGAILAAQKLGILTFELQHAAIEFDNILYSYSNIISTESNIAFPDYLLTYGDYWGVNINIPCKKIIPIGNDFLYKKNDIDKDDSVLIISTIIHGEELAKLTLKIALENPDLLFVYKLHINEYKIFDYYSNLFSMYSNIKIVRNEEDISALISKSQLVILIISTVLYEALNQNRKVAVFKKLNYGSQKGVFQYNNVYLFDQPAEVKNILSEKVHAQSISFFKPLDLDKIRSVLKQ